MCSPLPGGTDSPRAAMAAGGQVENQVIHPRSVDPSALSRPTTRPGLLDLRPAHPPPGRSRTGLSGGIERPSLVGSGPFIGFHAVPASVSKLLPCASTATSTAFGRPVEVHVRRSHRHPPGSPARSSRACPALRPRPDRRMTRGTTCPLAIAGFVTARRSRGSARRPGSRARPARHQPDRRQDRWSRSRRAGWAGKRWRPLCRGARWRRVQRPTRAQH